MLVKIFITEVAQNTVLFELTRFHDFECGTVCIGPEVMHQGTKIPLVGL